VPIASFGQEKEEKPPDKTPGGAGTAAFRESCWIAVEPFGCHRDSTLVAAETAAAAHWLRLSRLAATGTAHS